MNPIQQIWNWLFQTFFSDISYTERLAQYIDQSNPTGVSDVERLVQQFHESQERFI
jgi:hypothetical protein